MGKKIRSTGVSQFCTPISLQAHLAGCLITSISSCSLRIAPVVYALARAPSPASRRPQQPRSRLHFRHPLPLISSAIIALNSPPTLHPSPFLSFCCSATSPSTPTIFLPHATPRRPPPPSPHAPPNLPVTVCDIEHTTHSPSPPAPPAPISYLSAHRECQLSHLHYSRT